MADPADPIKTAIETLQRELKEHGDYTGPVDGVLSPELYESITKFTEGLGEIEGIARIINQTDEALTGVYDTKMGVAIKDYFASDAFTSIRTMASVSEIDAIKQLLRSLDVPQAYLDNTESLFALADGNLTGIIDAMDTLEAAGRLERSPNEVTPEQLAAQPKAIEDLETIIKADVAYYLEAATTHRDAAKTAMEALPDDATEEQKAALQGQLDTAQKALETWEKAADLIKDVEPDGVLDPNYSEALKIYVQFLQYGNNATAYVEERPAAGQVLDISKVIDGSGGYTEDYRTFLKARMESFQERYDKLKDNDSRTPEENLAFEILDRTMKLNTAMDAMIDSGAYVPPEPGEPPRETLPLEQAQDIIEEAMDYMVRKGKIEFEPVLDPDGKPNFDLEERMAMQAFLIDLRGFMGVDIDDESGRYTQELHNAFAEKLADENIRKRVADEYFKGNIEMVAQLLPALNTYNEEFPHEDENGLPYSLADDVLITKPQLKDVEADMMVTEINRMPDDELLAMNEFMISLTGYGMEDFLPEDALGDMKDRLELGGDRSELLGDLYVKVKQEAIDALNRDGRSMDGLEEEIQNRMVERFNNLVENNAAFGVVRAEYMRNYIRDGVSKALAAEASAEGNPQVILEAGKAAFVAEIPSATEFGRLHGANARAYFLINPETIEGVTPEVMRNFGGETAKISASMTEAFNSPTMSALISDMEEDFERLQGSDVALRTIREVRTDLAAKEAMLERIYNDADNAAFKDENGAMVVRGLSGETVLLRQGADGFEMRYLDANGITIEGLDESKILNVGEEFDLDALLIKTASAGYQSMNQGAEWKETHNPEFFELNGKHYVVGMDKQTNSIQVVELDESFLTASNAARRVYSVVGPAGRSQTIADFMKDPAYKFMQDNYDRQFSSPGSADRIFQFMLQQLDSEEADLALHVMADYSLIDFAKLPKLEDAPIVEQSNVVSGIFMVNRARPDEDQMSPSIYLREGDGGEQNIYVVIPALKEEIVTADDGTETTKMVPDTGAPPIVRDISDPHMYQGLRDLFVGMDVIPGDVLESSPAFAELREWLVAGGRPPLKEPPTPAPVYEEPTAEGLKTLFDSAAGFEVEGRDLTFGEPITDVNALVAVLGYNPNEMFLKSNLREPELSYVVHGMEPGVWQGSADHHEFLDDHVLITMMRDGEPVTVAMSKDVVENNPMRIGHLIRMEHEHERQVNKVPMPNPSVFVADRDQITTSAEGVRVPVTEFTTFMYRDPPGVVEVEVEKGPRDDPKTVTKLRFDDQSWFDQRNSWRQDFDLWLRDLDAKEADEDARLTPDVDPAVDEVKLSNAEMLSETIADINSVPADFADAGGSVFTPEFSKPNA